MAKPKRDETIAEIASPIQSLKTRIVTKFRREKTNYFDRCDLLDPRLRATVYDYFIPSTDKVFAGCRFLRREDRKAKKGKGKLHFCLMKYAVAEADLYSKLRKLDPEKVTKFLNENPDDFEMMEGYQSEYLMVLSLQFFALQEIFRRLILSQLSEGDRYFTLRKEITKYKKSLKAGAELKDLIKEYLETREKFLEKLEKLSKLSKENLAEKLSDMGITEEKYKEIMGGSKDLYKLKKAEELLKNELDKPPQVREPFLKRGASAERLYELSALAFTCPHAFESIPHIEELQHFDLKHLFSIERRIHKGFKYPPTELYNRRPCPYLTRDNWWNEFWTINTGHHEQQGGIAEAQAKSLEQAGAKLGTKAPEKKQDNLLILVDRFLKKPLLEGDFDATGTSKDRGEEGLLFKIGEGMSNLTTVLLLEAVLFMYRDNIKKVAKSASLGKEYPNEKAVQKEVEHRIHILELACLFHELAIIVYYCEWTNGMMKKILRLPDPKLIASTFTKKREKQVKGAEKPENELDGDIGVESESADADAVEIDDTELEAFIKEIEEKHKTPDLKKLESFELDAIQAEELYEAIMLAEIKHALSEEFELIASFKRRQIRRQEKFVGNKVKKLPKDGHKETDLGVLDDDTKPPEPKGPELKGKEIPEKF